MLPVRTEIAIAAQVLGAALAGAAPRTMAPAAIATVAVARVIVDRMRIMVVLPRCRSLSGEIDRPGRGSVGVGAEENGVRQRRARTGAG
jgi:hypothetical protein